MVAFVRHGDNYVRISTNRLVEDHITDNPVTEAKEESDQQDNVIWEYLAEREQPSVQPEQQGLSKRNDVFEYEAEENNK